MDTTPLYGLPYPETTDGYDDALLTIPQALAEQVESTIAGFGGIASPGSWVVVGSGGGGVPAFATGWGNFGSGYQTIQFRKVGTIVTLRGLALASSNRSAADPLFTLPPGFCPLATESFRTNAGTATGGARVDVDAAGVVSLPSDAITSGQFASVSGISFHVD